jgi:hypothetical protein
MQQGQANLSTEEVQDAVMVVDAWRQLHAEPLAWVTTALMRRLSPVAVHAVVAQRLKRMPQIIKKLARYEKMNLARMQDIGLTARAISVGRGRSREGGLRTWLGVVPRHVVNG